MRLQDAFFSAKPWLAKQPAAAAVVLRDYQTKMVGECLAAIAVGSQAALLVAPTGAGKTVVIAALAAHFVSTSKRVLILAHRRELIRQASSKLLAAKANHGVIAPGHAATDDLVQVGSVQTVGRRITGTQATGYDVIIIDEAHHSVAGAWRKVIEANPGALIIGVTATPERLDGRGLGVAVGGVYDTLILGPSIAELQAAGHLVRARVFAPSKPDLKGVANRAGDYAPESLAAAMERGGLTGDAVAHYRLHADHQPAIAFCATVEHARHVAEAFRAAGYRAFAVDGTTPDGERDAAILGLEDGRTEVLCSCQLISEGLDLPAVSCVILLRATSSLCFHIQAVGRGLRPAAGKSVLTILDHSGNCHKHGLPDEPHEWSLDGKRKRPKTATAIRQCPDCYCIHRPAATCPECGHAYAADAKSKARLPKSRAGELVELTPAAKAAAAREAARMEHLRTTALPELLRLAKSADALHSIARAKGFKPGWAFHQAKQLGIRMGKSAVRH